MNPIHMLVDPLATLRGELAGEAYAPGDDGWDLARQAWNLAVDQRPALVVIPAEDEDVVATVRYAAEHGLRVAPQGTGHNAEPLGPLDDTILLKTHELRGVEIDAENLIARVRAGDLWQDVAGPAGEHGLAPLSGSSPDVGVVGYTLGGGLSWLARKHGIAADSVTAIELVTADGELRRIDADNDPDLFWAMRGGGGNFGIVTALEFRLYELPEVYAGMLLWPWERSRELYTAWRDWTETVPDEVTTSARILHMPPIEEIPEFLRGRSWFVIDGAYIGDKETGDEIFAPLRELGPEIDTYGPQPPAFLNRMHMDPEAPMPYQGADAILSELSDETLDALLDAAGPGSDTQALLLFELRHMGGVLSAPREGSGALGSIDGAYLLFAAGLVMGPESFVRLSEELATIRTAAAPWSSGRRYLNFAEHTSDAATIFGPSAERLARVKADVDPYDLFHANHQISA